MAIMLLKYAGIWGDSMILVIIAYGAVIILMFGTMVWRHWAFVASRIRGCTDDSCDPDSWFAEQLKDQALKAGAAAAVESILKKEQDSKPQNSKP